MMRRLLVLALVVGPGLVPQAAPAQQAEGGEQDLDELQQQFSTDESMPSSSAELVTVETRVSKRPVPAGDSVEAAVVLRIDEGWHVNAHRPTLEYLIGTALELTPQQDLIVGETRYPEPERLHLGFADEMLDVYQGEVPVFLELRTSGSAEPGTRRLTGSLRVQACNDRACLRPSTIAVEIPVEVAAADAESRSTHEALFASFTPGSGSAASGGGNRIASAFVEAGALWAFLSIFVIGLALNLTPCVYPMLSVTISLFADSDTPPLRAFGRASIYVAGIVVMYSGLGAAAALSGQLFGAWLQSAWVTGGVGVLLLALAASMFGAYELQLPASVQTKLGGARSAAGPAGMFLSGLLVGVFAAPCVGPPVIALLTYVGTVGDPVFGVAALGVMALGLGLPYLLLGTFSGLLHRLPRSGTWMVWVERLFGVVLVGAGLFYLGLAWAPDLAYYAVPLTLAVGGLYLALTRAGGDSRAFSALKWAVAAAALVLAVLAFNALQKEGVSWTPYSRAALAEARTNDQLVLLDFYADWCIPCKELDRITFTDEEVVASLGGVVTLKVDLTEFDAEEAEEIRQQYRVAGVPTLVFLDGAGNEVEAARAVGFIGPDEFLQRLERARRVPSGTP